MAKMDGSAVRRWPSTWTKPFASTFTRVCLQPQVARVRLAADRDQHAVEGLHRLLDLCAFEIARGCRLPSSFISATLVFEEDAGESLFQAPGQRA